MSTFTEKETPAKNKKRRHPPGPFGNVLWGVLRQFQQSPLGTLVDFQKTYGDAVRFHAVGPFYGYQFSHPDHHKHILQDNNQNYTKIPHPTMLLIQPVVGNGLLTSDGDFWRRQRRLAQPAFHRRRIAELGATMTAATDRMLVKWETAMRDNPVQDVDQWIMELTLEIVGRTLFSIDVTQEADKVGEAFTAVNEHVGALTRQPFSDRLIRVPFLPMTRKLRRNTAVLDEVVNRIIDERRAMPDAEMPDDLLTMFMQAQDEETGEQMDDKQLRDEVMTILLAGHETTAVALTWTFYLLSQHPTVREALLAEVDGVLNGRLPTINDMPNLPYTTMVIEEAMRLYPPAYAIGRFGHAPDTVGGYDTTKNAVIILCPFITHRHPDFWENPETFDPERFTPERKQERPRYAYLPFGGGPRQCIGNNFAMTEAILLLTTICQRFNLDLIDGYQAELHPLITLRPKHGMPMKLSKRKIING